MKLSRALLIYLVAIPAGCKTAAPQNRLQADQEFNQQEVEAEILKYLLGSTERKAKIDYILDIIGPSQSLTVLGPGLTRQVAHLSLPKSDLRRRRQYNEGNEDLGWVLPDRWVEKLALIDDSPHPGMGAKFDLSFFESTKSPVFSVALFRTTEGKYKIELGTGYLNFLTHQNFERIDDVIEEAKTYYQEFYESIAIHPNQMGFLQWLVLASYDLTINAPTKQQYD